MCILLRAGQAQSPAKPGNARERPEATQRMKALLVYNRSNCIFHLKHSNVTLRQAECYFYISQIQKVCWRVMLGKWQRSVRKRGLACSESEPIYWLVLMSEMFWSFPQPIPVLSARTFGNLDIEVFNYTDLQSTARLGWKQLRRLIVLNSILLVLFSK